MKNINDFPELKKSVYNLSLSHFEQGLDITTVINNEMYPLSGSDSYIKLKDKDKMHILHFVVYQTSHSEDEQKKALYNFAKNSLLSLIKNKNIDQKYLDNMAFGATQPQIDKDFLTFLLESNAVNANLTNEQGYSLLMCTKDKAKIDQLIKHHADVNLKVTDSSLNDYNKTVYEMALESRKKGWIEYLRPYVSQDVINSKSKQALTEFKKQTSIAKQLKCYCNSLKQNNLEIINEIKNNQKKYEPLISYYDGYGKNLITHAISKNSQEVLTILLEMDYYQNNKAAINKDYQCYTTAALHEGKHVAAKMLYLEGFKDEKVLINFLNSFYYSCASVMDIMIDQGYKPNLNLRMRHFCYHKLEEQDITQKQIDDLFVNNKYLLNLSNIQTIGGKLALINNNEYHIINTGIFKILFIVLEKQKSIDPDKYDETIKKIVGKLGQNEEKIALRFSSLLLKFLPEEKNNLIDYLGLEEKREWLVKMTKIKLEKSLQKFAKEEDQPSEPRKMKI